MFDVPRSVFRISYLVSRISYLVSRISYLVFRISYLVFRISYLVFRISSFVTRHSSFAIDPDPKCRDKYRNNNNFHLILENVTAPTIMVARQNSSIIATFKSGDRTK